jgi:hypothetical protein
MLNVACAISATVVNLAILEVPNAVTSGVVNPQILNAPAAISSAVVNFAVLKVPHEIPGFAIDCVHHRIMDLPFRKSQTTRKAVAEEGHPDVRVTGEE